MKFRILTESVEWDYFNKFQPILDKYMPDHGEGETIASQIVTAVNKLIYKWYNDGDVFDNQYALTGWANDLSSYANWLYKRLSSARPILDRVFNAGNDSEYEELLKDLADKTLSEEFLAQFAERPALGSIYDCDGPYKFIEPYEDEEDEYDYEDEYDEDYLDESLGLKKSS